ncbi:MAG: putative rane protein [Deltaproteobacteria bacterium]|nr:putative rane protein [Deltaproteobacteria bacterium]
MFDQAVMMSHIVFGVFGILFAVALYMDVSNASETNLRRIKVLSWLVAVCVMLSYIVGGYWYVQYYGEHRNIIKAGQWPWAHTYFMEVKEHLFFIMLILSIYLPVAVHGGGLLAGRKARRLTQGVCLLIVLLGLFMEFSGGIIGKSITMALLRR